MIDRRSFFLLGFLLLGLWGCSHNSIQIGTRLTGDRIQSLEEGKSDYQAVLARLGPPIQAMPYGSGFVFLYASFRSEEAKWKASYGQYGLQGKFDISTAFNWRQVGLFYFDGQGILKQYILREGNIKPGWGMSIGPIVLGFDVLENPFFEKYDYYHQEHVPILFSLLERYPRPPQRRDRQDLKYIEGQEVDEIENRLLETQNKRHTKRERTKWLEVDFAEESAEMARYRIGEIREERERVPLEKAVPYAPNATK